MIDPSPRLRAIQEQIYQLFSHRPPFGLTHVGTLDGDDSTLFLAIIEIVGAELARLTQERDAALRDINHSAEYEARLVAVEQELQESNARVVELEHALGFNHDP